MPVQQAAAQPGQEQGKAQSTRLLGEMGEPLPAKCERLNDEIHCHHHSERRPYASLTCLNVRSAPVSDDTPSTAKGGYR